MSSPLLLLLWLIFFKNLILPNDLKTDFNLMKSDIFYSKLGI
ncbi:hypothetical protein A1OE_489 [Candidatus Endolissoclinum faulkneri L2]|uniref:Uncharacterized protein n=1 Tax=Candidatus Endolissoclinum faulkneri L2 TaxID=1193729 RepID=K7YMD8_9PROT|nr:hypothetical protein A1OE_489 [Candidatus Endolissoclinum faulkneri L2]